MKGYMRRRGPSWELRAYLGRDPVSGRKRYANRSVRGSKRAAEHVLRDMVSAAEAGVTHRAEPPSASCARRGSHMPVATWRPTR